MSRAFLPDGQTQLLALFGKQLSRSPSPHTHSQWARALNLNLQYSALPIETDEEFTALVQSLTRSPHFLGGNITNPFKTTALSLAELPEGVIDVEPTAYRCGAANTIYRNHSEQSSQRWTLANTDLYGCSETLRKILNTNSKVESSYSIVVLGSGAMMQACLIAIEDLIQSIGLLCDIFIVSREPNRIRLRREEFQKSIQSRTHSLNLSYSQWTDAILENTQKKQKLICINTLPALTSKDAESVVLSTIKSLEGIAPWTEKNLFCMTYGLQNWHRSAEDQGWRVYNGDLLFEVQARASFKLWTQLDAPNLPIAPLPS